MRITGKISRQKQKKREEKLYLDIKEIITYTFLSFKKQEKKSFFFLLFCHVYVL